MRSMQVEIIRHISDLEKIKDDWISLYEKDDYSVFQSFEYNYYSMLSNNEESLFVIILRSQSRIVEIWPCVLDITGRLRFINHLHADFCDILSDIDTGHVASFIMSSDEIRSVSLQNIKSSSNIYRLSNYFTSGEKIHMIIFKHVNFSEIDLKKTDNFPSNFSHFVNRQRRRLKRILKKYDGDLKIYGIENNIFPKEEIISLKNKMIERGVRKSNFLDEQLMNVSEELYKSGKLKISMLMIGNNISAISFFFQESNQYLFWIDLFDDKRMINLYNNILFIKKVTLNEDAVFNFGRGDYLYKVQNFDPHIYSLYNIRIFKNKFKLFLYMFFSGIRRTVKSIYRLIK